MRDILFKNLTSCDRRKRVLASYEIADDRGVHSVIQRRFICVIKEVKDNRMEKPSPSLYILKEHSHKQQRERFLCRIKGSVYTIVKGKIFLILYAHSLKIDLVANLIETQQ